MIIVSVKMLYLPRRAQLFILQKSLEANVSQGRFLIDIVLKWCWDQGMTCPHTPLKHFDRTRVVKQLEEKKWLLKCPDCGSVIEGREKQKGVIEL